MSSSNDAIIIGAGIIGAAAVDAVVSATEVVVGSTAVDTALSEPHEAIRVTTTRTAQTRCIPILLPTHRRSQRWRPTRGQRQD